MRTQKKPIRNVPTNLNNIIPKITAGVKTGFSFNLIFNFSDSTLNLLFLRLKFFIIDDFLFMQIN